MLNIWSLTQLQSNHFPHSPSQRQQQPTLVPHSPSQRQLQPTHITPFFLTRTIGYSSLFHKNLLQPSLPHQELLLSAHFPPSSLSKTIITCSYLTKTLKGYKFRSTTFSYMNFYSPFLLFKETSKSTYFNQFYLTRILTHY